ncbi:MAG: hypothetical protein HKN33_09170 [Pyrinomonadaceae bacterium]|nr:hypothetical protein [Pyrinomonadaceae bacterium]
MDTGAEMDNGQWDSMDNGQWIIGFNGQWTMDNGQLRDWNFAFVFQRSG